MIKNKKFKYARANNFLCFGEEGIELDFKNLSNIVHICSINHDAEGDKFSSNGGGKCFRKDTPILMADGTIKMVQDICVGEQVMGPDSSPRKVLSLGDGKELIYEIRPDRGDSYFVNESHILTLKLLFTKRSYKKNNKIHYLELPPDDVYNVSVKEFLALPQYQQCLYGTYRASVEFPKKEVSIDPYLLGMWLANDINENLPIKELYELNLVNNKHVPDDYKANDKDTRLQVLAGIIDSSNITGRDSFYTTCKGGFYITCKDKLVAEDFIFIAKSLGFDAKMKFVVDNTTKKYYSLEIFGNYDLIPVRFTYSQKYKKRHEYNLKSGIRVIPTEVDDYYGFTVDQDNLFLLSDFTVVHNSSVPEIPVYALYGKTIKRPKKLGHSDIVHNRKTGDLYAEFQWDDYRVVRTREAGKGGGGTLQLWRSEEGIWNRETEITRGGMPATQKYIEEVLGLNYQTFVNVYVFGDDSTNSFLECDTGTKREIVENLLSLEKYRIYHEVANDFFKDLKKQAKEALKDYEIQQQEVEAAKLRIKQVNQQEEQWLVTKKKEQKDLLDKIEKLKIRLTNSGHGQAIIEFQEAQAKIAELNSKVPDLQIDREKINDLIAGALPRWQQVSDKISDISNLLTGKLSRLSTVNNDISKDNKEIETIRSKKGQLCPFCKQEINESHSDSMIEGILERIKQCSIEKEAVDKEVFELSAQKKESEALRKKMDDSLSGAKKKIQGIDAQVSDILAQISKLSKIKEPKADVDELIIHKEIETLANQFEDKKTELANPSPYCMIKIEAEKELSRREEICLNKKNQVLERDKDIPYLDFWTKAFGDKGIRKYVIDGIIPTLNKRIAHWLQFLVDNKIKLTLDNELNEVVSRYPFDDRLYVYDGLSHGQRRRLMLALAQSFAYIMTLNCGSCPSALFLDECTMNMDEPGVEGIYRMICELAKERQVFVIDHNKNLMQKLSGCDTIVIEMRNGVARRIK